LPHHPSHFSLWVPAAAPENGLRNAAHQTRVGTAVRPSLFSETAYAATLTREYNMIKPEDVMKWWVVRRDQGFNFRQGDEVVSFALAHRMKVRGHCLIWDHDNPKWLTEGRFTTWQLSELFRDTSQPRCSTTPGRFSHGM